MSKKICLIILSLFVIVFTACGKDKNEVDTSKIYLDDRELIVDNNSSDYILATEKGILQLYDNTGNVLDTLDLKGTSKSSFIYCKDSGEIYSKNLLNINSFNSIFYAVDKANGKLFLIENSGNKLKTVDTISLKAGKDIVDIKAYNGIFCYMVKGNGIKSNKFTISTISTEIYGVVDFMQTVGVERRGKTYSYIYVENLFDKFIKHMDLDKKLTDADISNINLTDVKKECIRIPYDVNSWTLTNNQIIYFAKDVYGEYDLNTDILTACYGTDSSSSSVYRPGRYSSVFALNQLGNNSEKSLLMQIDPDDLSVGKVIEFNEEIPIDMYIDSSSNVLYIAYKLENQETYGKVKIYDLSNWKEINNIAFDFVPTKVRGHNGYYYIMNEYEDFMVLGTNSSKDYSVLNKYIKEQNAVDILLCDTYKKDFFLYDANGRYINENANLLDYRGNLINSENHKINKYGQRLDDYGRAVNANGELVDKYNNIVDENGIIIQYTQQKDGYYRSANGTVVDSTGKAMIRQDDGSYIIDEEIIPELEWHYDENGTVIINPDYLEKYPDAASWVANEMISKQ